MTTVISIINCIDQDRPQSNGGWGYLYTNISWELPTRPNLYINILTLRGSSDAFRNPLIPLFFLVSLSKICLSLTLAHCYIVPTWVTEDPCHLTNIKKH